MHRSRSRPTAALVLEPAAVILTACPVGREPGLSGSGPVAKTGGTIPISYVPERGHQDRFVGEAAGAGADEPGADRKVVNLGNDADREPGEVRSAVVRVLGSDGRTARQRP
ncbi:hypothetical protein GCM10018781_78410 [Kitasatospora indigofera]|uniref:Uncharacterized protein n=1 Tax=Kitasatospora indigofera TaxID=67307 RepID=A0A918YVP7_9ACTN|nr:hypothetical protein [Kitasatospora indigofera]GHE26285.1 hypothetical protein GCM10018781_78410 [Kitasatospora indigofera]